MPQKELPLHLGHQPVFALEYFDHDGRDDDAPLDGENETDCQFLSVGRAQWDPSQVSVKILRFPEQRWSRQSEELPPARLVDAVAWLCLCIRHCQASAVTIPAGLFENQPTELVVERVPSGRAQRQAFTEQLASNALLRRRLSRLRNVLNELFETEYNRS